MAVAGVEGLVVGAEVAMIMLESGGRLRVVISRKVEEWELPFR
jgi:hypothetical protein